MSAISTVQKMITCCPHIKRPPLFTKVTDFTWKYDNGKFHVNSSIKSLKLHTHPQILLKFALVRYGKKQSSVKIWAFNSKSVSELSAFNKVLTNLGLFLLWTQFRGERHWKSVFRFPVYLRKDCVLRLHILEIVTIIL